MPIEILDTEAIDSMTAGRELDKLIATRVMNYKHVETYWLVHRKHAHLSSYEDWRGQWQRDHPRQWPASEDIREFPDTTELRYWEYGEARRVPDFSTEIEAAWLVVEHLAKQKHYMGLAVLAEDNVSVLIRREEPYTQVTAYGETMPLVICQAALKATANTAANRGG